MVKIAIKLLGPFDVLRDGESITTFESDKARALLAHLVSEPGQAHRREMLAGLLWPERPERTARTNLRRVLANLRKAINDHQADPPYFLITRQTIQFNFDSQTQIDISTFMNLLEDRSERSIYQLEEAVKLYRGDFLKGFYLNDSTPFEEWALLKREEISRKMVGALVSLSHHYERSGDYDQAIAYARRQATLEPWEETNHHRLMGLYMQVEKFTEAIRQYRHCVRALERELDVRPSPTTIALYELIRTERTRHVSKEFESSGGELVSPPAFLTSEEAPIPCQNPLFVGRERELEMLDGYLESVLSAKCQIVFITGGPGRGKTALMEAFASQAMLNHPDLRIVQGTCNAYFGKGDPYLPFRRILDMLTGDVEGLWAGGSISKMQAKRLWDTSPTTVEITVNHGPSLVDTFVPGSSLLSRASQAVTGNPDWLGDLRILQKRRRGNPLELQQSGLFDQYVKVLCALSEHYPLLLCIDDFHWADDGSINLFFHLGRRLADLGSRILVLCAYRPEELAKAASIDDHPVSKMLGELKLRYGDNRIDLAQSDEISGPAFVEALLESEPNQLSRDFHKKLYSLTGGHSLFTVEILREMQQHGDLVRNTSGCWVESDELNWRRLPAKVEAVIANRLGRLDNRERAILELASVEGDQFTAQVIAQIEGLEERDVLNTLSRDLETRHRMVRGQQEIRLGAHNISRYKFTHALFQVYLNNTLAHGERRLLHGEIALALEDLYGKQTSQIAVPLAHHYQEAGWTEKAIVHLLQAGEQARLAYAHAEAINHFRNVLVLLDEKPGDISWKKYCLQAQQGLGLVYFGIGKNEEAEAALREAIELGKGLKLETEELIRLYYWLSEVLYWLSRFEDYFQLGQQACKLLDPSSESVEMALVNHILAIGFWTVEGSTTKYCELSLRNAAFIQKLPYDEILAPVYLVISNAYRFVGDIDEAVKWLEILGERAKSHGDYRTVGQVLTYSAGIMFETGDFSKALLERQKAIEIFNRIGDRKHLCLNQSAIGESCLNLGDLGKAADFLQKGYENAKRLQSKKDMARCQRGLGTIYLCQNFHERSIRIFQKAIQLTQESGFLRGEIMATYLLGRTYLASGNHPAALERFQACLTLRGGDYFKTTWPWVGQLSSWMLLLPLSAIEAVSNDPQWFQAYCHNLRKDHLEIDTTPFVQWYLEPVDRDMLRGQLPPDESILFQGECQGSLPSGWNWIDPFDDCSITIGNGLEIHAANGRSLLGINFSAPRVIGPIVGDFSLQTCCHPAASEKPAIGGLLLWVDKENYLRLDLGFFGVNQITFWGVMGNQTIVVGRGYLDPDQKRDTATDFPAGVYFRMQRIDDQVNAFCSADGKSWFTVGTIAFQSDDPGQVGLYAIGEIYRPIYQEAFPEGSAIHFQSTYLWGEIEPDLCS